MDGLDAFAWRLVHVGFPAALILASPVLLAAVALVAVLDALPPRETYLLFALGAGSWLAGVGWGLVVNRDEHG